jgi:hypothetical protein
LWLYRAILAHFNLIDSPRNETPTEQRCNVPVMKVEERKRNVLNKLISFRVICGYTKIQSKKRVRGGFE